MAGLAPRLEPEPVGLGATAGPVRLGDLTQLHEGVEVGGEDLVDLVDLLQRHLLERGREQRLMVGEVVVEQPVGDAGAGGDVSRRGPREPALGDLGDGGIEDRGAALVGLHACHLAQRTSPGWLLA